MTWAASYHMLASRHHSNPLAESWKLYLNTKLADSTKRGWSHNVDSFGNSKICPLERTTGQWWEESRRGCAQIFRFDKHGLKVGLGGPWSSISAHLFKCRSGPPSLTCRMQYKYTLLAVYYGPTPRGARSVPTYIVRWRIFWPFIGIFQIHYYHKDENWFPL